MDPHNILFELSPEHVQNLGLDELKRLKSFISVNTKTFIKYTIYTYKVKTKRIISDDKIYNDIPILIKLLPRACSVLLENRKVIAVLQGSRKFSGITPLDDDVDNPGKTLNYDCRNIYNHQNTLHLAESGNLEIVRTSKLNGKNAVMTISKNLNGGLVLIAGSKNFHLAIDVDDFISPDKYSEFMNMYCMSGIIRKIFLDIREQLPRIISCVWLMKKLVSDGCTLGGELCDGEHFTIGDDKIYWFGLFYRGVSVTPLKTLMKLKEANINCTTFEKVFNSDSSISHLEKVFNMARSTWDEGNVLYLINTQTNKTTLVKCKSTWYIVLRFMRQCLLRGYKCIEDVKKRFIEASDYHGLNTEASIRVTKKLMDFGFWMMNKMYPCKVLGHLEVKSVRGVLPNGFNIYWREFLDETKTEDITFTNDDFNGTFSEELYINSNDILLYQIKDIHKRPIVLFIQGLQGSGKSSMAEYIKLTMTDMSIKTKIIEQDQYYGDTAAAQGALYHFSQMIGGPDLIIVSRCNVNPKHYNKYLSISNYNRCRVLFCSPDKVDLNYFIVSLSGLFKRSINGDSIMIGRFENPFDEVYEWVLKNFTAFKLKNNSIKYYMYNNSAMLDNIASIYSTDVEKFKNTISKNWKIVDQTRNNIAVVCRPIIDAILNTVNGNLRYIHRNTVYKYGKSTVPTYIGLFLDEVDRNNLTSLCIGYIHKYGCPLRPSIKYKAYCEHLTQYYLGNKGSIPESAVPEFEKRYVHISSLVIRKKDSAMAFNVDQVFHIRDNKKIIIPTKERPHITAYLPVGIRPMESNLFITNRDKTVVDIIPLDITMLTTSIWV